MLLALALVVRSSGYQGQTAASHAGADGICLKLGFKDFAGGSHGLAQRMCSRSRQRGIQHLRLA